MASAGRLAGLASMFMMGAGMALPAFAMDCAKAVQPIEKRICASSVLRAADARMNSAYSGALKAAPDTTIRDMLVRGQRRAAGSTHATTVSTPITKAVRWPSTKCARPSIGAPPCWPIDRTKG